MIKYGQKYVYWISKCIKKLDSKNFCSELSATAGPGCTQTFNKQQRAGSVDRKKVANLKKIKNIFSNLTQLD